MNQTHCTGGWVDPRAAFNERGKSHAHQDSIPLPPSPQRLGYCGQQFVSLVLEQNPQ